MIKLILILLTSYSSQAVDLLQETKNIECVNSSASVLIDKRDRFIEVLQNNVKKVYASVEFLDSAILLKSKTSDEYALLQLTPKNKALVIMGEYSKFAEATCKDTGASKLCGVGLNELLWTPEIMMFGVKGSKAKRHYDIYHYGVYPNDGTYFIGLDGQTQGIGLIDFGSSISLVKGQYLSLDSCDYKN